MQSWWIYTAVLFFFFTEQRDREKMTHFLAVMVRLYKNIIICRKNSSVEQSKFTLVWLDESCLAFSLLLIWSQPFRRVNTELPSTIFLRVRVNNHVSSRKMKGLLHIYSIWESVIILCNISRARNKTLKDELLLENNRRQHGVMRPDVKRSYCYLPKADYFLWHYVLFLLHHSDMTRLTIFIY